MATTQLFVGPEDALPTEEDPDELHEPAGRTG